MSSIQEKIERYRNQERTRQVTHGQEHDAHIREIEETRNRFARECRPFLRPARSHEYAAWLRGYIETGGEPSHVYDYAMPSDFYIAVAGFRLIPLYGASAVHIIVPATVTVEYEDLGHNTLYYMDGYRCAGGWVPLYDDLRF